MRTNPAKQKLKDGGVCLGHIVMEFASPGLGVMDAGADGIMVPNVQSRAEAERIIQATKYAPLGSRGTAFGIAHDDFEVGDVSQTMTEANEETLIIAQIESVNGVKNVEEIVGVEGVDVGWIGHFDLTQSMGIPGQFEHPDYLAAVEKVIAACQRQGKAGGFMGATPAAVVELVQKGFRCIAYGSDIRIYHAALMEGLQAIRKQLKYGQAASLSLC
jgi:2-dehydro-3-deoxyglucarate aldolase/4-hydroxy-2-oxoheptanedioate aldolase